MYGGILVSDIAAGRSRLEYGREYHKADIVNGTEYQHFRHGMEAAMGTRVTMKPEAGLLRTRAGRGESDT